MPIVRPGGSDSATFDNVLELLMLAGRSLPHAIMMMIPEAHEGRSDLPDELKAFYEYHSSFMEPWDGPAAVAFTDGRLIGATLDRNGLRPGRWLETYDGWVVLGSEAGLLGIEPERVKRLGRLQPGKLFLVDLERHRIVEDEEVKAEIAGARPYRKWLDRQRVHFGDLAPAHVTLTGVQPLHLRQLAFGYSQEDLRVLIAPMAARGEEPVGSMGNDNALAVLSDQRPPGMHRVGRTRSAGPSATVGAGASVTPPPARRLGPARAATPSLLAAAAVHPPPVRAGNRLQAGLVLESGEPREVHHFATLI